MWRGPPPITAFTEREPTEEKVLRFRTEVKVAFDAANLYVFVSAFDPRRDSIIRPLERRNTSAPSDMIRILVDSYHDRRTGYRFGVNAAGVNVEPGRVRGRLRRAASVLGCRPRAVRFDVSCNQVNCSSEGLCYSPCIGRMPQQSDTGGPQWTA